MMWDPIRVTEALRMESIYFSDNKQQYIQPWAPPNVIKDINANKGIQNTFKYNYYKLFFLI